MKQHFLMLAVLNVMVSVSCKGTRHLADSTELFKSSILAPVKSFTSGVEGPAVEKDENAFAVILVFKDHLKIKGYGKEVDRILK